ncbi:MAG: hypothetical protein LC733_09050 [Actinobacteria bacterium]|nr:hypothetical protein [Actinomycetota bacterium]
MRTRSTTTRNVFLVIGSLSVLLGLGLGVGGGTLLWAHNTQRDSAGFYSTSAERLDSPSFALTSQDIDLGIDADGYGWIERDGPTAVRLRVTAANERPVFVGIARSDDVESYLASSAHGVITDFAVDPFRPEIRPAPGAAPPVLPGTQSFWTESAAGTGTQTVIWPVKPGNWTVVVMNADGSPGITVDVAVGAKSNMLLPIGIGMSALALLAVGGGIAFIVARSAGGRARPGPYDSRTSPGGREPADRVPVPSS